MVFHADRWGTAACAALTGVLAGAAALGFSWLFAAGSDVAVAARVPAPRTDDAGAALAATVDPADHCNRLITQFARGDGVPAEGSGRWPGFRGPARDNISRGGIALADSWPEGGPRLCWEQQLGEGHSGAAIWDGAVYVLDYDEERDADALRCLSLADGQEIWRRWYPVKIKRNHGISRTVPAVSERFIVSMGPKCHVLCVDRDSGDVNWGLDLALDYGTDVPLWYTGQCPLIDDGVAVLAPAGRYLLMGMDCETGEVVWTTPNPHGWKMSHSSVMTMNFGKRRAYVYAALGGVVAVAADGDDRGTILWESSAWNHRIVAPSPVWLDGDRVFVTSGHSAGSMVLEVATRPDGFNAEPLLTLAPSELACEQQTPVYWQGHLFGVMPKDGGELREQFVCATPAAEVVWSSGRDHRFGLGPWLFADGKVFVLSDRGTLYLLRASTSGFEMLDTAAILDGRDAWAPLALADGFLIARDDRRMVCLDVAVR